jgi:hypothetical protein
MDLFLESLREKVDILLNRPHSRHWSLNQKPAAKGFFRWFRAVDTTTFLYNLCVSFHYNLTHLAKQLNAFIITIIELVEIGFNSITLRVQNLGLIVERRLVFDCVDQERFRFKTLSFINLKTSVYTSSLNLNTSEYTNSFSPI